jgi:flavin-dependent thymidylate synthase
MPVQKNTVELIGYYGSDETHACSAWTSTSRTLSEDKRARIPKMLADLAGNGHHTPFEKSGLHFMLDSEVASHVHVLKHRVGVSVNAESARYKELKEDKYYIPQEFYDTPISEKYGLDWYKTWADALIDKSEELNFLYHGAVADLEKQWGRKRAKEIARYFKMYNSQLEADVMFNWRSFYHFQTLRNSEHAQKEIMLIADEMLTLVKNIEGNPFEHTIAAFKL